MNEDKKLKILICILFFLGFNLSIFITFSKQNNCSTKCFLQFENSKQIKNILKESHYIPLTNPSNYQCKNYPSPQTGIIFVVIRDLMKQYKNNKEKALEYIHNEFRLNENLGLHSIESQITFGLLLQAFDMSIRCNMSYLPHHLYQLRYAAEWPEEEKKAKQLYKVKTYYPEVFQQHHRLRNATKKVLNYISTRDIIDLGAYCGDSLVLLAQYTNKNVYSYEYSKENFKLVQQSVKDNGLIGKVIPLHKGISDESRIIKTVYKEKGGATRLNEHEDGENIELTTIDNEAKKFNFKVGLIKGDIEGYELKAMQGALQTLKRDRPVISLSLYHNAKEFFGVPRLIREELGEYQIEYYFNNFHYIPDLYEMTIFAYPNELL